jgi:hypothetical protein
MRVFRWKGNAMLSWLIRRQIDAFERRYDYDTTYLRDMLAGDPRPVRLLARLAAFGNYRRGVPPDAWYAAKIATTLKEDCGPCTQLLVTMAERAGVDAAVLRAILASDLQAMPEEVALGFRLATASLAHAKPADELRAEVRRRWGQRGLVSLACAIASARLFPTLKYALGHGEACRRVTVAGAPIPVLRRAA